MQGAVFIFTKLLHCIIIILSLLHSGLNSFPAILNNCLIGVNDTSTIFATMEREGWCLT